ncbi:hypothetical protein Pth03_04700 [Planotetraspora thailandica]|uniref:Resolvase/invertase-type recombinase catalytic domain-containing protein n=1 Tax=Planotetraspora thailandica TaxID=487172 RepID=A0A8J3UZ25_9ACTN|nr:recombinase family protein [Planotetraspora thailandica]GII52081.1 hypothetical protein Pth03_04700 [Planotetraspora thailandica]
MSAVPARAQRDLLSVTEAAFEERERDRRSGAPIGPARCLPRPPHRDPHRLRPRLHVSTAGQKLERQIDALKTAGCRRIFADKNAGKNADRPELAACHAFLAAGDTLVVPELARYGRSLQDLITMVGDLRKLARLICSTPAHEIAPGELGPRPGHKFAVYRLCPRYPPARTPRAEGHHRVDGGLQRLHG